MLTVSHLFRSFPTVDGNLTVLKDLSFTLMPGESMAVLGPSGSGKSTLLNILGAVDTPTSGEILLNGINPFTLSPTKLALFRNHNVGFLFQDHHLLPQCTVLENVLIPTLAAGSASSDDVIRARKLLERVNLSDRAGFYPSQLSGGQRQRTATARAVMMHPALLLADEPTGNLDRINAQAITELLIDLCTQESTILILATHSELLAGKMDKKWVLES